MRNKPDYAAEMIIGDDAEKPHYNCGSSKKCGIIYHILCIIIAEIIRKDVVICHDLMIALIYQMLSNKFQSLT